MTRPQDLLWETWMQLAYHNLSAKLTDSERGRINKALKELRAIDATPDELKRKWGAYKSKWPSLGDPTITALTAHWNSLGQSLPRQTSYIPPPSIPLSDRIKGLRTAKDNLPSYFAKRIHTEDK